MRLNHTLGNNQQAQGRGRGFAGGQRGGGGRGGGGRGGRGSNINFGFQLQSQRSITANPFPSVGGQGDNKGANIIFGYVRHLGRIHVNGITIETIERARTRL